MAVITDPTDPGYNSFVSLEEADVYFNGYYFVEGEVTWEDQSDEDQEKLLITSSRAISVLPWSGVPVSPDQSLAFPRYYTPYGLITDTVPGNPSWLKPLTLEYSKWLFQEKAAYVAQGELRGIKKMDVDVLSITYQDNVGSVSSDFISSLPASVLSILATLSPAYIVLPGPGSKPRSMSMVY